MKILLFIISISEWRGLFSKYSCAEYRGSPYNRIENLSSMPTIICTAQIATKPITYENLKNTYEMVLNTYELPVNTYEMLCIISYV